MTLVAHEHEPITAIAGWHEAVSALHERIAPRFA
jgi:hypothetical protein